MFKVTQEYDSSLKHFQLALTDSSPCTAPQTTSKYIFHLLGFYKYKILSYMFITVKFHIAHLLEVQGKVKSAKEKYELLLREKNINNVLRSDIFRQLGKYVKQF